MADSKVTRRDFVRKGTAAGLAASANATAASSSEEDRTTPHNEQAAADQDTLAGGMPYGMIGDLKISRLIFGSNTPGAHSRDLIYVRLCPKTAI